MLGEPCDCLSLGRASAGYRGTYVCREPSFGCRRKQAQRCASDARHLLGNSIKCILIAGTGEYSSESFIWLARAGAAQGLLPNVAKTRASSAFTCFACLGTSKAHRKPQRRIRRLPDASQARCQESFGLLGRLTLVFLGCGCCCVADFAAAKKNPRKAVPARPRAAHVRPRKSGDECATYPHMGPPHAAPESSRGRALTVGCCVCTPGLLRRRV